MRRLAVHPRDCYFTGYTAHCLVPVATTREAPQFESSAREKASAAWEESPAAGDLPVSCAVARIAGPPAATFSLPRPRSARDAGDGAGRGHPALPPAGDQEERAELDGPPAALSPVHAWELPAGGWSSGEPSGGSRASSRSSLGSLDSQGSQDCSEASRIASPRSPLPRTPWEERRFVQQALGRPAPVPRETRELLAEPAVVAAQPGDADAPPPVRQEALDAHLAAAQTLFGRAGAQRWAQMQAVESAEREGEARRVKKLREARHGKRSVLEEEAELKRRPLTPAQELQNAREMAAGSSSDDAEGGEPGRGWKRELRGAVAQMDAAEAKMRLVRAAKRQNRGEKAE